MNKPADSLPTPTTLARSAALAGSTPADTGASVLGVKVALAHLRFGSVTLRNVTEIHYGYNRAEIARLPANIRPLSPLRELKIAFESDVHGTGMTYAIGDVLEFETFPETERAEQF